MLETASLRILDRRGLAKLGITFSRGHLWRLEGRNEFPRRVKLTKNGRCGWVESEIHDWLRQRVAGSRTVRSAA